MVGTRPPLTAAPNMFRWSSWKIHTIAPNVADSDNTLSTSALSGKNTLPVNRNRIANVASAIPPSAYGSLAPSEFRLSTFSAARPVSMTCHGAGAVLSAATRLAPCFEYGSSVVDTLRYVLLPDVIGGPAGGATCDPCAYVPAAERTLVTPSTVDRRAAYAPTAPGAADVSGTTTLTVPVA